MSEPPGWSDPDQPPRDPHEWAPPGQGPWDPPAQPSSPPGGGGNGWGAPGGPTGHGNEWRQPGGPSRPDEPSGQPGRGQSIGGQPGWGQPGGPAGADDPRWSGEQWGGYPAPYKPGIIPLRPMGVGEILDGAFASLRQNPGATLGLSAAVIVTVEIVQLVAALAFRDSHGAAAAVVVVLTTILTFVATLALAGALTVVISEAVLGSRVGSSEALTRLRGRIGGLVGVSLLVILLTAVAVIGLFIGSIYVWVLLSLATPAYVLERGGVRASLRRSRELVRGSWWRIFGILLLALIVTNVVAAAIHLPFGLIGIGSSNPFGITGDDASTGRLVAQTIAAIIANTIVTPVSAGVYALLYVDQRMRREGLDVTLAQVARGRAAEGPPR